MLPGRILLMTVTVWASGMMIAYATSAEEGCITDKCHQMLLKPKTVHPVSAQCDTCHVAKTSPHPQRQKKTFGLVQGQPGLCSQCHAAFGSEKHVHMPVKEGTCTTCHDPHASREPRLLVRAMKDLCLMCHGDKIENKYVHGPAATGDCTACHNPHESKNRALATMEGPPLCFSCHTDIEAEMGRKFQHPAIKSGCTSCHNPHSALYRKLLPAGEEELCFQCHPGIAEKIQKASTVHRPIKGEKGCAACHLPHASDTEKLLTKTGKDLCLECHKGVLQKTQTVLHGPIKDGRCTPCHDPHGSVNNRLLVKEFKNDFYLPYSDNEYGLCFLCHNRDMLKYQTTSFATGFRDGEKNLHYLHVNRPDKGRNCRACHEIHGGELPKLIADKVAFGKWNLPLRFTKTETGGTCAPGCHQKFSYDRKTPGRQPEAARPAGKDKTKVR